MVIEELDFLAKPEPIRNLKIVRTMQYGEFDVSLFSERENCEKIAFNPCHEKKNENCETRNKETLQSHFSSSLQIKCRKRSVGKSFRLGENFKLNRWRLIFPLLFHTVNRFHVNNNSCNVLKSYDVRAGKCESNELGYRKTLSFYHAIYPMDIIIQSNGHNG